MKELKHFKLIILLKLIIKLKKNLKYLLNNKIKFINFDLFNINDYSYYYIMKIIYFFTKVFR